MLIVDDLVTSYGLIKALRNVSLEAEKGKLTCILGPNGAGKSTLLFTIAGILKSDRGSIQFLGRQISKMKTSEIVKEGLVPVPENRLVFPHLSVRENLLAGAFSRFSRKDEVEEDVEVPFAVIENVPVFPGCERGNNEKKRKCMSEKIAKFVQRKFNTDLAGDLGLTGRQRISVIFKIDKSGNVTGVRARAPHPRLEKEAQRVINLLPKMQPGKQRGKAVIVPYSLPIIFQVQD